MNHSRRKLLNAGLGTVAGLSGLAIASKLADRYGLLPPDSRGVYGPGETLTYASQRLLTRHSMAREFSRDQISIKPFVNGLAFTSDDYKLHEREAFANWKLSIDGLVARPATFSMAELKSFPSRSQITHLACEEGWSYIAEWAGVPLGFVLDRVGILPQAKYIIYASLQKGWEDSIDMSDALHPQTMLTYSMNGADLPTGHGGPLRMRVPRQLGYKSVKYIHRITVTDRPEKAWPGGSYAWFAGI